MKLVEYNTDHWKKIRDVLNKADNKDNFLTYLIDKQSKTIKVGDWSMEFQIGDRVYQIIEVEDDGIKP